MNAPLSATGRKMAIIGAVIGWAAVVAQLYLILANRTHSVTTTVVQFFSYFTILSNILVAFCFSMQIVKKGGNSLFWKRPGTQAAIAVYIMVVGIVYNAVLRFLWAPTGAQQWVDECLHLLIPLYFLVYWIIYASKKGIQWVDAFAWLLFPFLYLVYVMVRGALTDLYPYPFLDAYNHGYQKVALSSGIILLLFLMLSLAIISASKSLASKERQG